MNTSQVEELQDRIHELEDLLGTSRGYSNGFRAFNGMTPTMARFMGLLMKRDECTREQVMIALYGGERGGPDYKAVDVHVSKLRKCLMSYGIEITTLWGVGYCLSKHQKQKVRDFLEKYLEAHE